MQSYAQQHQAATDRLADLDRQFESAVASILGITAEQQPQLLAEALQEQQQLQEVQVRLAWLLTTTGTLPLQGWALEDGVIDGLTADTQAAWHA